MNYKELDRKARELKKKYKAIQIFCKDRKVTNEKSFELNEYEKKIYNQYLFYDHLKKTISKGGDHMACGGKKKK